MSKTTTRFRTMLRRAATVVAATALLMGIAAGEASAEFGLEQPGGLEMSTTNQLAGAHADLKTHFAFNRLDPTTPDGTVKEMHFNLPPGFVGNPESRPRCEIGRTLAGFGDPSQCPMNTVVGMGQLELSFPGSGFSGLQDVLIYNVTPYNDEPAAFAFSVMGFPVRLDANVLSGDDYRVRVEATGREELYLLKGDVTFWGVPADHTGEGPFQDTTTGRFFGNPEPLASRTPFLSTPTECDGQPQPLSMELDSWQNPGSFLDGASTLPALEGCDVLPFEPSLSVNPETHRAGVPAGYSVDLSIPQINTPDGRVVSHLKDATVTLPQGTALSPGVANGLSACSPADMQIGTEDPATCPAASKVGRVSVQSPLLPDPVAGDVFVGERRAGNKYPILLAFEGYGLNAKVEGIVSPDPVTGQLTTRFVNNPQLPFNKLHFEFKGGPNAVLVNPPTCGPAKMSYELKGWSGAEVSGSSTFQIDEGCGPRGFAPKMSAGSRNPVAGKASPFTLRVVRGEGEQDVSRIDATLPPGEVAKLAGVPLCADAQAVSGNCPSGSQIGTTTVGVGAGSSPLYVPQPGKAPTALYLAGPYKGAPYSLVAKVPVQAGPFDLGVVAVRSAIDVDSSTAQVSVSSDPLPQIVEGIPVAYRDVRVDIDRPDFTRNPTSCDPMQVAGRLVSATGTKANVSSRFQVGDCAALGFSPKLSISLTGGTTRAKHPALKAVLTAPPGQANIGRVAVALPPTEFIDNARIRNPCTRVQFAANSCPAQSVLGRARAYTPLLDKPLEGPVYFRSNGGERKLPDLVADLGGQIHIVLVGYIDSVNKKGSEASRVRSTFAAVPDAPVSKFVLELKGEDRGLLVNNTNLCKSPNNLASVRMDGQNGKTHDFHPTVSNSCGR
jgi:hypothetical protein